MCRALKSCVRAAHPHPQLYLILVGGYLLEGTCSRCCRIPGTGITLRVPGNVSTVCVTEECMNVFIFPNRVRVSGSTGRLFPAARICFGCRRVPCCCCLYLPRSIDALVSRLERLAAAPAADRGLPRVRVAALGLIHLLIQQSLFSPASVGHGAFPKTFSLQRKREASAISFGYDAISYGKRQQHG